MEVNQHSEDITRTQRLFVHFLFILVFVRCVASDVLRTICHLAIVNVCVIIILSIGNTQISILLLCFLYLFVELTPSQKQPFSFLGQLAIISARHARQLVCQGSRRDQKIKRS